MTKVRLESPEILRFQPHAGLEYALLDLDVFSAAYGLTRKREIEQQGALHVVRTVTQDPTGRILYEESGRPYLEGGPSISISHSYNKLAVLFSEKRKAGIDIEKVREKIFSIKEKFLSPEELNELDQDLPEKYTLYWAAKEAVYKAAGIGGLIFAKQLLVEPFAFSSSGGSMMLRLQAGGEQAVYRLAYRILNDFVLVYTESD